MSYQVLARKYRPKNFETLVGQEHVVRALTHALGSGRLHHAYLFTGTRGVGKTTLSRILAKSLNCIGPDGGGGITAQPCGVCEACTAIDAGRFVDYIEMDAASNRGVDEMAQLLEQAVYAPSNARFKVYMIDEVHMLTNHAFNSMLKTLEEPPEHVKFILATTDPQKIPVTVLSRCLQFNLKQMPPGHIVSHLDNILGQEGISFEQPALRLLAQGAHGSMRDALSLTDQAIAYAAGAVTLDAVQGMLGALDQSYLVRLLDALANQDGADLLAVADEMAARSLSYNNALQDLGTLLHRIALAQTVPAAVPADLPEYADIMRLASAFDAEEVQLYYQIAVHGRNELGLAPDEYAGFSMTLLRMLAFRPGNGGAEGVPPAGAASGRPAGGAAGAMRAAVAPAPARAASLAAASHAAVTPPAVVAGAAAAMARAAAVAAPAVRPQMPTVSPVASASAAPVASAIAPAAAAPADETFARSQAKAVSEPDDAFAPLPAKAASAPDDAFAPSPAKAVSEPDNAFAPMPAKAASAPSDAFAPLPGQVASAPEDAFAPLPAGAASASAAAKSVQVAAATPAPAAAPAPKPTVAEAPTAAPQAARVESAAPPSASSAGRAAALEAARAASGQRSGGARPAPASAPVAASAAPVAPSATKPAAQAGVAAPVGAAASSAMSRAASPLASASASSAAPKGPAPWEDAPAAATPVAASGAAPTTQAVRHPAQDQYAHEQYAQNPMDQQDQSSDMQDDDLPPWVTEFSDDTASAAAGPAASAQPQSAAAAPRQAAAPAQPPRPYVIVPVAGLDWDGNWPAVAAALPLRGVAQQLAVQTELIECLHDGHSTVFKLRVPFDTLRSAANVDKLIAALAERFDRKVQVETELGPVWYTASAEAQAYREANQLQAEQTIRNDPFVLSLMRDFGAVVVPGSIMPAPAAAP